MFRLTSCLAIVLFAMTGSAEGMPPYRVVDLGTLGGSDTRPYDINASGVVVGRSRTSSGANHAFLYRDGTMADLSTLPDSSYSYARGINDDGQIVGYSGNSASGNRAFLYSDETMTDLGLLSGYTASVATAVNSGGQVTGYTYNAGANYAHGFLYQNGTMVDIGRPEGHYQNAIPSTINASGQIAGYANNSAADEHAVIYRDEEWTDLGTLGGEKSRATSINDAGQVVGWSWMSEGPGHAFLYEQGVMKDLGVPVGWRSSVAMSINSNGTVLAQCGRVDRVYHAFLYDDGQWTDLNDLIDPDSGWSLSEPVDINDSGQVIGIGTYEGNTRAFLLTPVPEPSTFALLAMGAIGLLAYGWRHREIR